MSLSDSDWVPVTERYPDATRAVHIKPKTGTFSGLWRWDGGKWWHSGGLSYLSAAGITHWLDDAKGVAAVPPDIVGDYVTSREKADAAKLLSRAADQQYQGLADKRQQALEKLISEFRLMNPTEGWFAVLVKPGYVLIVPDNNPLSYGPIRLLSPVPSGQATSVPCGLTPDRKAGQRSSEEETTLGSANSTS